MARFATTHWSVVLRAACENEKEAQEALEELCSTYWYPIYAFCRRCDRSAGDAEDLTQEFFKHLIEKHLVGKVTPNSGKFRSFLLVSCKNYINNYYGKLKAAKRGGGIKIVSIDKHTTEALYALGHSEQLTPEMSYEKDWFSTILEAAFNRLADEFEREGKQMLFNKIKQFLQKEQSSPSYREVAEDLNMSEAAIKTAVSRMRKRYRTLLIGVVKQTVSDPSEVEEELRTLFQVFSR